MVNSYQNFYENKKNCFWNVDLSDVAGQVDKFFEL